MKRKHACRIDGFQYRKAEDRADEKLIADVETHGWHIVGVPEDEVGPGFAFTVGLYLRTLQPEVLIMGVPFEPAVRVLNAIGEHVMTGRGLEPERRYSGFVDNLEVIFRRIAPGHYRDYLGTAMWFYKHHAPDFPALQCIWPDPDNKFPHEPGFDQRFASKQIYLSNSGDTPVAADVSPPLTKESYRPPIDTPSTSHRPSIDTPSKFYRHSSAHRRPPRPIMLISDHERHIAIQQTARFTPRQFGHS